jgi:hypothetical protein
VTLKQNIKNGLVPGISSTGYHILFGEIQIHNSVNTIAIPPAILPMIAIILPGTNVIRITDK